MIIVVGLVTVSTSNNRQSTYLPYLFSAFVYLFHLCASWNHISTEYLRNTVSIGEAQKHLARELSVKPKVKLSVECFHEEVRGEGLKTFVTTHTAVDYLRVSKWHN